MAQTPPPNDLASQQPGQRTEQSQSYARFDVEPTTTDQKDERIPTLPLEKSTTSTLDELLPLPTTTPEPSSSSSSLTPTDYVSRIIFRISSLAVIITFVLCLSFIAATTDWPINISLANAETAWSRFRYYQYKGVEMAEHNGDDDGSLATRSLVETVFSTQDRHTPTSVPSNAQKHGDDDDDDDEYVWPADEPLLDGLSLDVSEEEQELAKYTFVRRIPASHVATDIKGKRVIFVGDVHGEIKSLKKLLDRLSYSPESDYLIHVGDLVAKGSHSTQVVRFMRKHKVRGVRGNHDQKVIEYRNWMETSSAKYDVYLQQHGLPRFQPSSLTDTREAWQAFIDDLSQQFPEKSDEPALHAHLASFDAALPPEWKWWKSEHKEIARDLSRKDFKYLQGLPLVLELPSLETLVVHAGILGRDTSSKRSLRADHDDHDDNALEATLAEMNLDGTASEKSATSPISFLQTIPDNRIPWNLENVRSVLKDGSVTKDADEGTPWADIWGREQERLCESTTVKGKKSKCKDGAGINVVYGHAASRGLDIKRHSSGLDSGCVYGRQLTALVLGDLSTLDDIKKKHKTKTHLGKEKGMLVELEC